MTTASDLALKLQFSRSRLQKWWLFNLVIYCTCTLYCLLYYKAFFFKSISYQRALKPNQTFQDDKSNSWSPVCENPPCPLAHQTWCDPEVTLLPYPLVAWGRFLRFQKLVKPIVDFNLWTQIEISSIIDSNKTVTLESYSDFLNRCCKM